MNTLLYLNNKYCTSVNDIKDVLAKIDNLESPLFHELRRAFQDGILSSWLSEGTPSEKELSVRLDEIEPSVTNEIILSQFNKLFADKDVEIQKPSYKNYFSLSSSRYKFSNANNDKFNNLSSSIFLNVKEGDIILELNFEILKTANLDYSISVILENDKKEILDKHGDIISLKSIGKTYQYKLSLDISKINNEGNIVVYVDDVKAHTFKLLNRPVPVFSKDCSEEQKKAIDKLLKSMKYVEETTDEFEIFDGEKHKATLTAYYISPLMTNSDYHMDKDCYDPTCIRESNMEDIKDFVKIINSLSSLKFELPSEAQWINAVKRKRKIITCGTGEWMRDKSQSRYNKDKIEKVLANPNPVWISPGSDYYVIRESLKSRSFGYKDGYCSWHRHAFRLVLQLD